MRQKNGDTRIIRKHSKSSKATEWFKRWERLRESIVQGDVERAEAYANTLAKTSPGRRTGTFIVPRIKRRLGL